MKVGLASFGFALGSDGAAHAARIIERVRDDLSDEGFDFDYVGDGITLRKTGLMLFLRSRHSRFAAFDRIKVEQDGTRLCVHATSTFLPIVYLVLSLFVLACWSLSSVYAALYAGIAIVGFYGLMFAWSAHGTYLWFKDIEWATADIPH